MALSVTENRGWAGIEDLLEGRGPADTGVRRGRPGEARDMPPEMRFTAGAAPAFYPVVLE